MSKNKKELDLVEFGYRVEEVREKVLKMNQTELGEKIGCTQTMISRLERGAGGNINIIFDLITFLHKKGIRAEMLFSEGFSLDSFTRKEKLPPILEQQTEKIKLVQEDLRNNIEELEKIRFLIDQGQ